MCIMLSDVLVMSLVLTGFKWLIYQHSSGLLYWHLGQSYHCLIHCQVTLQDMGKFECQWGTYFFGCIVYPRVDKLLKKFL